MVRRCRDLSYVERVFMSTPLIHAEDVALQRRASDIAQTLATVARPPWDKMANMQLEQTAKYRDIIERFGRFPHRNAILGRATTAAETEFLVDWNQKGPPRGAPSG